MALLEEFDMHSLSICRTCPRDRRESGAPGLALTLRLRGFSEREGMALLRVNCLGACLQPCTIALDAPRKFRLRFSGLRPEDGDAVEELAARYLRSSEGRPDSHTIPDSLLGALSAVSPIHPLLPPLPSHRAGSQLL